MMIHSHYHIHTQMESWMTFSNPQNISGASQQNSVIEFP